MQHAVAIVVRVRDNKAVKRVIVEGLNLVENPIHFYSKRFLYNARLYRWVFQLRFKLQVGFKIVAMKERNNKKNKA